MKRYTFHFDAKTEILADSLSQAEKFVEDRLNVVPDNIKLTVREIRTQNLLFPTEEEK